MSGIGNSEVADLMAFLVQDCHRQVCDIVVKILPLFGFTNITQPRSGDAVDNRMRARELLSNLDKIMFGDGDKYEVSSV